MLGTPLGEEETTPDGEGAFQHFLHGSIHFTPETGAWETHGAVMDLWGKLGWEKSFLRYPTSDELKLSERDSNPSGATGQFPLKLP
jgi:uncharacterized protein with LGFP repeats